MRKTSRLSATMLMFSASMLTPPPAVSARPRPASSVPVLADVDLLRGAVGEVRLPAVDHRLGLDQLQPAHGPCGCRHRGSPAHPHASSQAAPTVVVEAPYRALEAPDASHRLEPATVRSSLLFTVRRGPSHGLLKPPPWSEAPPSPRRRSPDTDSLALTATVVVRAPPSPRRGSPPPRGSGCPDLLGVVLADGHRGVVLGGEGVVARGVDQDLLGPGGVLEAQLVGPRALLGGGGLEAGAGRPARKLVRGRRLAVVDVSDDHGRSRSPSSWSTSTSKPTRGIRSEPPSASCPTRIQGELLSSVVPERSQGKRTLHCPKALEWSSAPEGPVTRAGWIPLGGGAGARRGARARPWEGPKGVGVTGVGVRRLPAAVVPHGDHRRIGGERAPRVVDEVDVRPGSRWGWSLWPSRIGPVATRSSSSALARRLSSPESWLARDGDRPRDRPSRPPAPSPRGPGRAA